METIYNPENKPIGHVKQEGKSPFHFRYYGNNNISFPVYANGIGQAAAQVCKYFGEGYFFLLFTI